MLRLYGTVLTRRPRSLGLRIRRMKFVGPCPSLTGTSLWRRGFRSVKGHWNKIDRKWVDGSSSSSLFIIVEEDYVLEQSSIGSEDRAPHEVYLKHYREAYEKMTCCRQPLRCSAEADFETMIFCVMYGKLCSQIGVLRSCKLILESFAKNGEKDSWTSNIKSPKYWLDFLTQKFKRKLLT